MTLGKILARFIPAAVYASEAERRAYSAEALETMYSLVAIETTWPAPPDRRAEQAAALDRAEAALAGEPDPKMREAKHGWITHGRYLLEKAAEAWTVKQARAQIRLGRGGPP